MGTKAPTSSPTMTPTDEPSSLPSDLPSSMPSDLPSSMPSDLPSELPSSLPSSLPSALPSSLPSDLPSEFPSTEPSSIPSISPTEGGACKDDNAFTFSVEINDITATSCAELTTKLKKPTRITKACKKLFKYPDNKGPRTPLSDICVLACINCSS